MPFTCSLPRFSWHTAGSNDSICESIHRTSTETPWSQQGGNPSSQKAPPISAQENFQGKRRVFVEGFCLAGEAGANAASSEIT